jgi:hypothetical protein
MIRAADNRIVVVAMHRPIKRGALHDLIRQTGVSVEAFIKAL